MKTKNPLRKGSYFLLNFSKKIVGCFVQDFTATQANKILLIERNTINNRYNYIREVIYCHQMLEKSEIFEGTVEADEYYFGPKRIRGKRGRGIGGKIKIFGLFKERMKSIYRDNG